MEENISCYSLRDEKHAGVIQNTCKSKTNSSQQTFKHIPYTVVF